MTAKRIRFILLITFLSLYAGMKIIAQPDTINISNYKEGINLENSWRYIQADSTHFASVNFNDSSWQLLKNSEKVNLNDPKIFRGITWCRASFYIDSVLDGIPLTLQLYVYGAADVFIDGRLIQSVGRVGKSLAEEELGFSAQTTLVPLPFNSQGIHHVALRTSNFGTSIKLKLLNITGNSNQNFELSVISMSQALEEKEDVSEQLIPIFFAGVFIVLSLFHFCLFLYYRRNPSNLYYSLFTFFLFAIFTAIYISLSGASFDTIKFFLEIIVVSLFMAPLFFIGILYEIFYSRLPKQFWVFTAVLIGGLLCVFLLDRTGIGAISLFLYLIVISIESLRVIIRAVKKKRDGAGVFVFGLLFPVIGTLGLMFLSYLLEQAGLVTWSDNISDYLFEFFSYGLLMSVSVSMTIYLGRDFAKMNRKLHEQINEIKILFEKTIEQENEKKKILETQKEDLEAMVIQRTEEVVRQKALIELKNKDILDNLLYAKRIQDAILPEIKLIYQTLRDSFIIYRPKDIVSGDFYAFSQKDDKVIIAAADCTGHGVTGAFMSMIGSSALNQIVNERGVTTPALILNQLNNGISEALKQNENGINDGMDISLCTFDLRMNKLQYAGANRPLWMIRNGKMDLIKPDKKAIGGFHLQHETSFTNHEIDLQHGDSIYMFTDGYADQFGGPAGKKLLSKRLRELLVTINNLSMHDQEMELIKFFEQWKGNEVQVDDVLVIGIRV